MFLKHEPGGSLSFTTHFADSPRPLYRYLVIPQAWSIGVELTFYIFVPLLTKLKMRWLILFAVLSLGLRIYAYEALHLKNNPFNDRFFPFELLLFLAGMIAHRIYAKTLMLMQQIKLRNMVQYLVFAALLVFIFYISQKVPGLLGRYGIGGRYAVLISYAEWIIVVPFLFHLTRDLKLDRFIGELSYPIYLVHFQVVELVRLVLNRFSVPMEYLGIISGLASILLAIILYALIFRPFEERRQQMVDKLFQTKKQLTSSPGAT